MKPSRDARRYCAAGPLQRYRNRDADAASELDERVYDEMNKGIDGYVGLMMTGCLDALEQMPAGSMRAHDQAYLEDPHYYGSTVIVRGKSAAEVQEEIELTLELLRELDAQDAVFAQSPHP